MNTKDEFDAIVNGALHAELDQYIDMMLEQLEKWVEDNPDGTLVDVIHQAWSDAPAPHQAVAGLCTALWRMSGRT